MLATPIRADDRCWTQVSFLMVILVALVLCFSAVA